MIRIMADFMKKLFLACQQGALSNFIVKKAITLVEQILQLDRCCFMLPFAMRLFFSILLVLFQLARF